MNSEKLPIRVVARRTGLTPHVIRAWERRYKVLEPQRSETNRRFYSAADVEKLNLLQAAIASGHSIGRVAALSLQELRRIAVTDSSHSPSPAPPAGKSMFVEACLSAVQTLDERQLESQLGRANLALGHVGLTQKVIAPLLDRIGELWRSGDLPVAHEHMASSVIRSTLGAMREGFDLPESAPRIVATTPIGQLHEFGALLAGNAAASEGWRVTYLGPNLPAAEIAGAAKATEAKAVALSVIYPPNDPHLMAELKDLRRLLGSDVALVIGGRAARSYSSVIEEIGALHIEDLSSFRSQLERLRDAPA
jgi:DNA-binding transcriptional MerR regulator/methylmalonyl-CoA mutase cobalamin-binding subunit